MKPSKLIFCFLFAFGVSAIAGEFRHQRGAHETFKTVATLTTSYWTAEPDAVSDIAVKEVPGVEPGDIVSVQQNSLGVVMIGRVSAPNQVTLSASNPSKTPVVVSHGVLIHVVVTRYDWPDPS